MANENDAPPPPPYPSDNTYINSTRAEVGHTTADDPEPDEDSCLYCLGGMWAWFTCDSVVLSLFSFSIIILITVFTIGGITANHPRWLCDHAPILVRFSNGIIPAVLAILPALLLSFIVAAACATKSNWTLRGQLSTPGRRAGIILLGVALTIATTPWAFLLFDKTQMDCAVVRSRG